VTRGQRARLFAALELPPEVTAELAAWARASVPREQRADVRLLGRELMHVTLCFLGARPVAEIDSLAAAVLATRPEPLALALGAPLWLPPRRPRALAVEITDERGALQDVHAQLVTALAAASTWEPERRRYRPHVTVARVRGGGRGRTSGRVSGEQLPATPALRFAPVAIALYRSWLSPAGARYEKLAALDLV
jgi:2'-5' RNA ligase